MIRFLRCASVMLSGFAALPACAAPPVVISTCVVLLSATTGSQGAATAKVSCDHPKDVLQANINADWPKNRHAKAGHFCASPLTYVPACTDDAATVKLRNLRHYSYRGAIEIFGRDAEFTAVTGSAARYCTTTSPTEIDCFFDGKR
jgi:hypothetical protein